MAEATFTEWLAVLIAFCALLVTFCQIKIAQKHNKLSVRPHLTTWSSSRESSYSIELINNGIGPAFINSFALYVDGVRVEGKGCEPIEKALQILFSPYKYSSAQSYIGKGYSMAAKERCQLVLIRFDSLSVPTTEIIDQALKRVRLVIEYSSIYEKQAPFDSEKLKESAS